MYYNTLKEKINHCKELQTNKSKLETNMEDLREDYNKAVFEEKTKKFRESILPKMTELFDNLNEMKENFPDFFEEEVNVSTGTSTRVLSIGKFLCKEAYKTNDSMDGNLAFSDVKGRLDVRINQDESPLGNIYYIDDAKENTVEINFVGDDYSLNNLMLSEEAPLSVDSKDVLSTEFLNEAKIVFDHYINYINDDIEHYLNEKTKALDKDISKLETEMRYTKNSIKGCAETIKPYNEYNSFEELISELKYTFIDGLTEDEIKEALDTEAYQTSYEMKFLLPDAYSKAAICIKNGKYWKEEELTDKNRWSLCFDYYKNDGRLLMSLTNGDGKEEIYLTDEDIPANIKDIITSVFEEALENEKEEERYL